MRIGAYHAAENRRGSLARISRRLAVLVSCSADSWLKTRRESAPCGVTSPRRARRRAEQGSLRDVTPETRECRRLTRNGQLHGRIPKGAAVEAEQGPQLYLGMRPEIRRKGIAPPPSIASEVRSPIEKRSGPLILSAAIPAPRCANPRHCRGLAPNLAPISQVFQSMLDCCQRNKMDRIPGFVLCPTNQRNRTPA